MPKTLGHVVKTSVDRGTVTRLERFATATDRTVSAVIRRAIREFLDRNEAN